MTPHDRLQHDLLARLKLGRNKNAASTTATSSEDNPVEANDSVHKEASQALTNTTSQISNNINNENNNKNNNLHNDTPAHQTTTAKTPAIIMPFTASDLQKKIKGVPVATVDHATSSVIKEKGGAVEEEGDMFALSSPDDPYGLFASIPSSSLSSSSSTQKKKSFSGNVSLTIIACIPSIIDNVDGYVANSITKYTIVYAFYVRQKHLTDSILVSTNHGVVLFN